MMRAHTVLLSAVATLTAFVSAGAGLAGMTSAAAATQSLCRSESARVAGGAYIVEPNEWDSSAAECLSLPGGTSFSVSRSEIANATNGAPGAYASEYAGCHWSHCTSGGLAGRPVPVSALRAGTVTSSWSTSQPYQRGSAYDVAYDIWVSRTSRTKSAGNGSEIMIWLNRRGGVCPAGREVARGVKIGIHTYNVWYNAPSSPGAGNTISYVMPRGRASVSGLDIGKVIRNSVARGYTSASWYLIDVEAGFELWHGGTGLTTKSFSVNTR